MKEISLDELSACEGLNIKVVTINGTFEGRFSCIYADMPASFKGKGICREFSVKDSINEAEYRINIAHVKQLFLLEIQ